MDISLLITFIFILLFVCILLSVLLNEEAKSSIKAKEKYETAKGLIQFGKKLAQDQLLEEQHRKIMKLRQENKDLRDQVESFIEEKEVNKE